MISKGKTNIKPTKTKRIYKSTIAPNKNISSASIKKSK